MRSFKIIFGVLVIVFMYACEAGYTNNVQILKAESVLYEYPDSAYTILKSISNPEKLSRADYAAWCLHFTHAQYKLFMNIESDSIINVAVRYYENSKLQKYRGTAYYLSGCISELLKRNKEALLAYKKAISDLDNIETSDILGLATLNMGYVYVKGKNYYHANEYFKKALKIFERTSNDRYKMYCYYQMSQMYFQLDQPFDSTMFYLNKAKNLREKLNNTALKYELIAYEGELLYNKDYRKAINHLTIGYKYCPSGRIRYAAILAHVYSRLNMNDSAKYYLEVSNKETSSSVNEVIKKLVNAYVYGNEGNYNQAYEAMKDAYIFQDSIFVAKLRDQIYSIDKQFDLVEKEKENAELKIANRSKIIWIAVLVIIVLIIINILLMINSQFKKKQLQQALEQQKLELELNKKESENRKKHDLLLSKLRQRIDMTINFNRVRQGQFDPVKQINYFDIIANEIILSEKEWQYYIDETNSLFNNKLIEIRNSHTELTPPDMIVISMICLGVDISDTCQVLNMTKNTMYSRRKKIKKRLNIDVEDDLEEWIRLNIKSFAA